MRDQPIVPDYSGANVRGIVPALLGPPAALPPWMPECVTGARQMVLLVLDGLGWGQLGQRAHLAPTLTSMSGGPITTVAPTTTATALTSITTGLTPGEHGLVGYRIDVGGEVLNVLRWQTDRPHDARRHHEPERLQPFAPFLGESVPVVSRAELERTAFSAAHLRGMRPYGWRVPSSLAVRVGQLLRAGERFVYAYYDGIDKIAHEHGFGPFYDAELRSADQVVAQVLDHLPSDAVLLVTADHGQVHVGDNTVAIHDSLQRLCQRSSGEGRFRWLHAVPGAAADLCAAAEEAHGRDAWVVTRQQTLDEAWFGPVVSPPVRARLGDVALVARAEVSFDDPAEGGAFSLVCRHGSMTPAEVYVPLVAARR